VRGRPHRGRATAAEEGAGERRPGWGLLPARVDGRTGRGGERLSAPNLGPAGDRPPGRGGAEGEQGSHRPAEQATVRDEPVHVATGAGERGDVPAVQGGPWSQGSLGHV